MEPLLTLWLESVVALSSLRTNCVGEPCALPAAMLTVTVPLTVAPLTGLVIEAVNGGDPVSWSSAAAMRIRGRVTVPPGRVSVIGIPVSCSAPRIALTEAPGVACFNTAQAPTTCGVDIDVPLR